MIHREPKPKKELTCPECGASLDHDWTTADPVRAAFFATLKDVYRNFTDEHRLRWKSIEHLRKAALIQVGHCEQSTIILHNNETAVAVAALVQQKDRYCIIDIYDNVMVTFTAKSLARSAIHKPQFLEVIDMVFIWIREQTGIDGFKSETRRKK